MNKSRDSMSSGEGPLIDEEVALLRRAANGEMSPMDELALELLLESRPEAGDWLTTWTAEFEERLLLKQLSSPMVPPSASLTQSMHRLLELRERKGNVDERDREETDMPDLNSESLYLVRKVGQGGMGVVYEGFDQDLGRSVAVKLLTSALSQNPRARELLLSEAQSAAQLQHENIVMIHSVHRSAERPYIVQQFVHGETLGARVARKGAFPFEELMALTTQLVKGLAAAHAIPLVHRDFKPDNILLEENTGIARIADFGLAVRTKVGTEREEKVLAGTPAYMSPEQTHGEVFDVRSDLFSLGSVLHFAATGKDAFPGGTAEEVLERVRSDEPESIKTLRPELPAWWRIPVERLLSKEPRSRYATSMAFLEDIHRRRVWSERQGRWVRIVAFSALVLVAIVGVVELLRLRSEVERATVGGRFVPEIDRTIWFEVEGDATRHTTLAMAVESASEGSVLRIHGQGSVEIAPIAVRGKALTIEMADDADVTWYPRMSRRQGEVFLSTDASLILRGLQIVTERPSAMALPPGSTIESLGGQLRLERCLIVESGLSACVSVVTGTLEMADCQLESRDGLILITSPAGVDATISNCWMESQACWLVGAEQSVGGSNGLTTKLKVEHSTVIGRTFARVLYQLPPESPLELILKNSLDLCRNEVLLTGRTTRSDELLTADALVDPLKQTLHWQEEHNVHQEELNCLGRIGLRLNSLVPSREIRSWNGWCTLWGLDPSKLHRERLSVSRSGDRKYIDIGSFPEKFQDCGCHIETIKGKPGSYSYFGRGDL